MTIVVLDDEPVVVLFKLDPAVRPATRPESNSDKDRFLHSTRPQLCFASPYRRARIPVTLLLFAIVSEDLPLTTEQDRIPLPLPLSIFISLLK